MAEASGGEHGTALEATAAIARDLIRFDTTNYGGGNAKGETEAAEYLGAHLERLGLTPTYLNSGDRRTSVIARIPGADQSKPALVVHGHTDVVPADPANWSVDPFEGVVQDDMLWGRGAVDMKDMDAMIITALDDIISSGRAPARDLIIAFFSDEENGGVYGSHQIVDDHPELFAGATEAISEVGGYSVEFGGQRAYLLQTGEKALVWVKLVAHGTAAHGSRVISDNAVTKLARAVATLGEQEWPVELVDTTTQLIAEIERIMGVAPGSRDPDDLALRTGTAAGFIRGSLRTTTNPTVLTAGYKHNVIPDTAEALIDIRTLPGQEATVLEQVRALVGPDIEVVTLHSDIGLENPFGGELVNSMIGALTRADPEAVVLPYLLSGGTDNKALSKLGITGYGFAPLRLTPELDFPAMFHGVDERVPLDALVFGRRVLGDLLLTY
jgi:acetylornithine deacetylase/succinyl-diaminopimelate desuccinylase-like protein